MVTGGGYPAADCLPAVAWLADGTQRSPVERPVKGRPGRLTDAQVQAIRQQTAAGRLRKQVAYEFNISMRSVTDVAFGRTYGHVPGALPRPRKYRKAEPDEIRQIRLYLEAGGTSHKAAEVFGRPPNFVWRWGRDILAKRKDKKT